MSALDRLRTIAEQAGDKRTADADGGYRLVDYRMPEPGAFVGERTGFVVVEPATVLALLDVAEAAETWCGGEHALLPRRVAAALDRLREVTS